ncbi:hypothetical protein AB1K84_14885 [Mesobacillus foraminis]|uniref:Uncharacterized protein n=1 Tax=Mesobacillus foraminis TaxID=279826 RepID=A0A4R2BKY2_9BACI|nr:hypothetical protein [Mesobacillus foraminis]TCN27696.1 hypothetical protein EV146_10123 [Mesobacillus foraminis]
MSLGIMILTLVTIGILALAMAYTLVLTKSQKKAKGNLDSKILEGVQERPYIRNPIFLTYLIFFALVLVTIIFFTMDLQQ